MNTTARSTLLEVLWSIWSLLVAKAFWRQVKVEATIVIGPESLNSDPFAGCQAVLRLEKLRSYDWADKVLKHLAGSSKTHNGDKLRVTLHGWCGKMVVLFDFTAADIWNALHWRALWVFLTCMVTYCLRTTSCYYILMHFDVFWFNFWCSILNIASAGTQPPRWIWPRHSNNPFGSDHMSFLEQKIQSVSWQKAYTQLAKR